MKLAFLASNNGSSMQAIVGATSSGELMAAPCLVVSNRRTAPALEFARRHGIRNLWIPTTPDPQAADARLTAALRETGVDLVILSGYLRKLGPLTLEAFAGRVLNIHPALLPKYGGQGMYGRRVHEAVIAAGDSESGATVHLVDDQYDHGPVLAQVRVPVLPDDTAEDLERRVTAIEPALFLKTLRQLTSGQLTLSAPAPEQPPTAWISDNIS